METNVIETKLRNVFNSADQDLGFDVNTPQFLKEACENSNGGMYAVCYNIFKGLLAQVAERATELHDPVLDALMIRLNLYEVAREKRYVILGKLAANYDAALKAQKLQRLREVREDAKEALEKSDPHQSESTPIPNSVDELEKEIEANYNPIDGLSFEDYRQIAKYFANWQRERIMQGALDGELVIGDDVQLCVPALPRITRTMDNGDKVKVLIVKKK